MGNNVENELEHLEELRCKMRDAAYDYFYPAEEDLEFMMGRYVNARNEYARACRSALRRGIIPKLPHDFPTDISPDFV